MCRIATILYLFLDKMPYNEREEIDRDLHRVFEEVLIKRGGNDLRVHFNDKQNKTVVLDSLEILMAKAQKA